MDANMVEASQQVNGSVRSSCSDAADRLVHNCTSVALMVIPGETLLRAADLALLDSADMVRLCYANSIWG